MSKEVKGWTDDGEIGPYDKKAPPPPDPGLYRFSVTGYKLVSGVGKDNKNGLNFSFELTSKYPEGDVGSPQKKLFATHAIADDRMYVLAQLADSCSVPQLTRRGSMAADEFGRSLIDSNGGILRLRHGKTPDGQARAEVAFGQSYLTEEEAAADLGGASSGGEAEANVRTKSKKATK